MVQPAASTGALSSLGSLTANRGTSLGQDQFLSLLVAQLRYQSPLNPLQAHEFAAQLASFSSVEQLSNVNDALAQQSQSLNLTALLSKVTFGTSLVGRRVVASGNQVAISSQGSNEIDVNIGGAGNATLHLYDDSGQLVATRDLGPVSAGRQTLALPADLPEGVYTYDLKVVSAGGSAVSVASFVSGVVDGVQFNQDQILLRIGGFTVPVDAVIEITAAEAAPPETPEQSHDDGGSVSPEGKSPSPVTVASALGWPGISWLP